MIGIESPYRIFIKGTGAVSRYKLPTKLGICHVTEAFGQVLVRCPGGAIKGSCYKKAGCSKTVTNKCPLLSVLYVVVFVYVVTLRSPLIKSNNNSKT
jgi:energy-converting hydrogenase Eha subunit F